MNVRQLYIVMFLLMALWVMLRFFTPERVIIEPLDSKTNNAFLYEPAQKKRLMTGNHIYHLGLALSGGGAKGFSHLGVLKALEEKGIKPDVISGVSAGAIIAALYADGYSTDSILAMYEDLNIVNYLSVDFSEGGLFSLKKMKVFLDHVLHAKTFEDLKIPLRVVVTDLDHGCSVVFDKGPLADALIASCSVPILFDPWVINGVHYVDGGLLHNLPAFALNSDCQYLMGVSLSPINADPYDKSITTIALRSYRFIFRSNANYDKSLCDILIEPNGISKFDGGDASDATQIYRIGYEAAIKQLDSLISSKPKLMHKLMHQ
jgi:NTE family protein